MKRQLDTAQAQAAPVKKQAKQADMASAVALCDGNNVATVAPTMPQPVALPTPGSVTPTNLVNAGWTYPPMPIMPFGPFMMPFGPFMPFPFWMPAAAAAAASAMLMPGGGLMGQQAPIASASTAPVCPATTATTSASTGTVPSAPGSAMTEAVAAQQSTVHCAKENCTGAVVYPKGNSPCPTPDLNSEVCSPSVATESSNDATDDEFHFFIDNFLGASDTFDSTANGLPHVDSLFGFFDGSLDAPEELKF